MPDMKKSLKNDLDNMVNAISVIKKIKAIQKLRGPETKKCIRWIIIKHNLFLLAMMVTWS